jgi:hypothetical protein
VVEEHLKTIAMVIITMKTAAIVVIVVKKSSYTLEI